LQRELHRPAKIEAGKIQIARLDFKTAVVVDFDLFDAGAFVLEFKAVVVVVAHERACGDLDAKVAEDHGDRGIRQGSPGAHSFDPKNSFDFETLIAGITLPFHPRFFHKEHIERKPGIGRGAWACGWRGTGAGRCDLLQFGTARRVRIGRRFIAAAEEQRERQDASRP
jgi:hypothetical protein